MPQPRQRLQPLLRSAAILALACSAPQICHATATQDRTPSDQATPTFLFDVALRPGERFARITVQLNDTSRQIRSLTLALDPQRYKDLRASGELRKQGPGTVWLPPRDNAQLSYKLNIDHLRTSHAEANNKRYDARLTERWAILRGDDLVPPTKLRLRKGIVPVSNLRLTLPPGWHAALPYPKGPDGIYRITNPQRIFDRPAGWMALGHLKIIQERLGNTRITLASPVGDKFRSLDVLALARWTLPAYEKLLGQLPEHLLIVGANDPMWRGGLSGPASVYLHVALPLIGPDGTSPLLHELTHTLLRARSGPGGDWISEGLAELYSLELLKRSGTLSDRRYKKALKHLRQRGARIKQLEADSAHGALTARSVTVLHKLDVHLRHKSENRISLDDVLRGMVASPSAWTTLQFRELCERIAGLSLQKFFAKYVTATSAHFTP